MGVNYADLLVWTSLNVGTGTNSTGIYGLIWNLLNVGTGTNSTGIYGLIWDLFGIY